MILAGIAFLIVEVYKERSTTSHRLVTFTLALLFAAQGSVFWLSGDLMNAMGSVLITFALLASLYLKIDGLFNFVTLVLLLIAGGGTIFVLNPDSFPSVLAAKLITENKFIFVIGWSVGWLFIAVNSLQGLVKRSLLASSVGLFTVAAAAFTFASLAISYSRWDSAIYSLLIGAFAIAFPFEHKFGTFTISSKKELLRGAVWLASVLFIGIALVFYLQQSFKNYVFSQNERSVQAAAQIIEAGAAEAKAALINFRDNRSDKLAGFLTSHKQEDQSINQFLKDFYELAPTLRRVGLIKASGKGLALYPTDPAFKGLHLSDRNYFKEVRAGGNFAISEGIKPIVAGAPVAIVLAMPVSDKNGRLLGVLIGSLDLARLANKLGDISLGENGTFIIADQQGKIILHRDDSAFVGTIEHLGPQCRCVGGL